MLKAIIHFSVKHKLIIGLFIAGLTVMGVYQLTKLPVDAVPDITDNQVQVITISPSLGAPDVERLVTFPVEQANSNIPGLKEIRSFSRFGLSLVTIVFDENTDVYWARQQVSERLRLVMNEIPEGIGVPELGPVTTGLGEIFQYVLRPKPGYEAQYGPMELRTIQDWIVRRQLLGVEGVADVSSFGGNLKQYEIAVDPDRLKSAAVNMNDVFNALAKNNQNTGGAYIEKGPNLLFIRSEGLIRTKEEIESIPVRMGSEGQPVLLRDIAEVRIGHAIKYGTMVYNDEREVAGAVVMMLKGANSNEVISNVKERIEKISKTLPEGVILDPFLDRTKMVDNAISTVKTNLLEGALIVVLVLVLFLGNFRAGFLVASVIPLSMLFAISMMNFFGVSGNLMSLGALDFGLIIDGAVIIVEAVLHYMAAGHFGKGITKIGKPEMDGMVEKTAGRMMNSTVFGQIIILVVYLPVFALSGIEGKMFKPMAQTVTFALLGAFILSLTYVPMMGAWFLSKKVNQKQNISDRIMHRLEKLYHRVLEVVLNREFAILGSSVVLLLFSAMLMMRMGGEFIPKLEEGDFAIETRVLPGSNLSLSMETSKKAAAILKKNFPEVEKVVAKIGSGEIPTDPMPIEAQDLMVILKDKKEWTSAKGFDELAGKMGQKLSEIPGVSFGFQYPVQMRFNELMTGARQDVVCKIFGEDLDSLASLAKKLGEISSGVRGAADIYVEPVGGLPQVVIRYNRAAIARYGTSVEEVNRIVNTAFAGQVAGQVFEGEKRFDLVVRLKSEDRRNEDQIRNLLVPLPGGDQIPLTQLASVNVEEGPNQIQREDAKRRIIVGFNVRGRDVQSIVKEMQSKVDRQIKLPVGYYITYGGAFENLQAARKRLGIAVPVSLLLIFMFLYFAFRSVKAGLLIYSAIPLSAIGGIIALELRGMPFSISAGVGFIALFGVAVLNGIVLISEFRRLAEEGATDIREIVLTGTRSRLRPVLMTAAVASLGFLPMALSQGAGAEVQRPLATVVIGGLISATFLTLFVLPVLYILFNKPRKPLKSKKVKNATATVIALLSISAASSQTPISLRAALDSALKNNLTLISSHQELASADALKKSAFNPDPAVVEGEYGQYNSIYRDNRFSVNQSIGLPAVYSRQKEYFNTNYELTNDRKNLNTLEIIKDVKLWYYRIVSLRQQEGILMQADSVYSKVLERAEIRFRTGESNILELEYFKINRFKVARELGMLRTELQNGIQAFGNVLNTRISYIPESATQNEILISDFRDTAFLNTHPLIMLASDQVLMAQSMRQMESAKLYPELNIGYNNTSIQGVGADEVSYSRGYRFQSAQLGLSLPLFSGATRSRIRSLDFKTSQAETELEKTKKQLLLQWQNAWNIYHTRAQNYQWYSDTGTAIAESVYQAAWLQYQSGEIDYLQFATLYNQVLELRSGKAEAAFEYNRSVIEINTLAKTE